MKLSQKIMLGVSILLVVLGIWQLITRGINFEDSSATQFLTTAIILLGITFGSYQKFTKTALIIIIVAVLAVGGYFIFTKDSNRIAQVSSHVLMEGSEVSLEGTYVKDTSDSELELGLADGASYLVMRTEKYGEVQVVIGGFRMSCLAKEIYKPSPGEKIEVYGKVVSDSFSEFSNVNRLNICSSDQYFIKKK